MDRKPRVILFEDDFHIRKIMELMASSNGHELFTYEDPSLCLLQQSHDCQCSEQEVCADIVITDIDMPHVLGLDFIEGQIKKGCKVKNFAILSGCWNDEYLKRAKSLDCTVFEKPSFLYKISEWIDKCFGESNQPVNLSNWFLDK